ncbi:FecR family protein [Bacteroides helcogenes]|uniref:Anti-FecI sigma factor, FecR n=1 Tax=Bacteroides helcogenes (strain ATCC 35417 / DSM 20613 / JCM 6297 / CCUG 15421 / P 36-108) TaxID=693979 RepID=E6SR55_BACT6|nr:FecR domain-containing protein [Bacteroides helcogenes]ADV42059.1 anti-FecI sigma factor, FecR [Bacteroides helcogenes P 36-108]MDY5240006.1 FecR domain-containing protein [Bacteroides helcogenes]
MGIRNENFDKVLNVLIASTRSPREHFSAANSWKLLEKRLFTRRSKRILQFRITSAAAIALLCIASWLIYNAIRPVPMQTISTLAETRTVILPDQTEVTLNHYSTLTYPAHFKGDCRKVELQGEAYFEVAKDAKHPFIVRAEAVKVQVLGTHFNVEAYPDDEEVRTTLLEGSVAVSIEGESQRVVLTPNQNAIYNKVKGTLVQEATPNASDEILWSRGIILFNQLPLQEIARQLSNTFHTEILIEDIHLRNYRMTATFHEGESLTEMLDLLKAVGNFKYKQTNDTITITYKLN